MSLYPYGISIYAGNPPPTGLHARLIRYDCRIALLYRGRQCASAGTGQAERVSLVPINQAGLYFYFWHLARFSLLAHLTKPPPPNITEIGEKT